jgi:hypothetical protein
MCGGTTVVFVGERRDDRAMRIQETARAAVVFGGCIAAIASATAPKPPPTGEVQRSQTIVGTFDGTWNAIVDLFAERDWKIDKLDKPSGLITTDWMSLSESDAVAFADCGTAPMANNTTAVRFNVVVREAAGGTSVIVNTTFRQVRRFGDQSSTIDCYSKGAVEHFVQQEAAARARKTTKAKPDPNERKTVSGTKPLLCVVTAEDVGECWLDEAACAASAAGASCESRNAGSCFNATKTLDGTKKTVCAVSIKDCETRLAAFASNPDYSVTKCGIYRVQAP